jgi:hypothetical protein
VHQRLLPLVSLVTAITALPVLGAALPASAASTAPTLAWEISQFFDEHLATHVVSDGATEDAAGTITFPNGVGSYDRATGAGSVEYDGKVAGSFVFGGATQYTITVADPIVSVDAEGEGTISVVVASVIPEGSTADPESTPPARVVAATFEANPWVSGEGDVGSQTATPRFAGVLPAGSAEATALGIPAGQPVDGQAFAPTFIGHLVTGVRALFYASGSSNDAKKAPGTFVAQGIGTGVATDPEPDPADGLRWKVSSAYDATSETHLLGGGATESDLGVVTFPRTGGTYDTVTGESSVTYAGSVKATNFETVYPDPGLPFPNPLPNPDVERYSVTIADPVLTTDLAGNGTITALVSSDSQLASGSVPGSTTPTRVEVVAFTAGIDPWVDGTALGRLVKTPTAFSSRLLDQLVTPARAQFGTAGTAATDTLPAQLVAAAAPAAVSAPAATVSTTSATAAGGLVLDVDGTGFRGRTRPGDTGIRVGLAPSGGLPLDLATVIGVVDVPAATVVGGAFSLRLTIPAAQLDPTRLYSVYTWQAPSRSTTTQDTEVFVPVDFAALGLSTALVPTVGVTEVTNTATNLTWDVHGTGFTAVSRPGDAGVYVGLAPASARPPVDDAANQTGFATAAWVTPAQIAGHAFTARLTVPRSRLEPGVAYAFYTWQAHTGSNPSQDTTTPVETRLRPPMSAPTALRTRYGTPVAMPVSLPATALGTVTVTGLGMSRTVPVSDGAADVVPPVDLPVGVHTATIRYSGDGSFAPQTVTTSYQVGEVMPRLRRTWVRTPTPTGAGRLLLRVLGPRGAPRPGGQVTVTIVRPGHPRVSLRERLVRGRATIVIQPRAPGSWRYVVRYSGSPSYTATTRVLRMGSTAS